MKTPALPRPLTLKCASLLFAAACTPAILLASTSGSSTPVSRSYIETPQSTTTITTYSAPSTYSPYSGGFYSGPRYSGTHGGWYGGYSYSHTIRPRRYFFPPNPPALGEPFLKNRTRSASLRLSTIPLTLSEYVNEPYYAPLSPFLYEESISKRRLKLIADHQAAKTALVNELREKLKAVRSLDPAERERQLAEFAREQTPRVAAVERTGYEIRDELTNWSFFSSHSDWNEARDWRLGDDTRWESTLDDAKVMRGAAYFQDGLSPAQRRLLREYAMELDDSGRGPVAELGLHVQGPYFYFTPELSRIRLPASLPADLQQRVDAYRSLKYNLKKELRDTLYREDRRWLASRRETAMEDLAARQAPQFLQLEQLAEEIRRGLAPLPNPARPVSVTNGLPDALADRIARHMDARNDYNRALVNKVAELKRQFPTSRAEIVKMDGGFGVQFIPRRQLRGDEEARANAVPGQLEPFNAEHIRIYQELVREKDAIRAELVKAAGGLASAMTPRVVDVLLREYSTTIALQELWRQFDDYDAAVLQPGLSAEQRRLLFDAALVKLDQQIPHYTY